MKAGPQQPLAEHVEGGEPGTPSSDDEQLAALGKTAELQRIYGFWTRKSFCATAYQTKS